jgi:hypothetical protein
MTTPSSPSTTQEPTGKDQLMRKEKLMRIIGKIYLFYLGMLPALATFATLWAYGYPWPFCLFIGGVAGVGVYLATVMSYAPIPNSLPWLLLALLDGPIFVLISLRNNFHPLAFAIEGYLIDGTAIWLSTLILASISLLPTRGQRIASIAIMLAVLGLTTSFFWPYVQASLLGDWYRIFWLIAGIVQATWLSLSRFLRGEVLREESDGVTLFIVGFVMLWVIAMIVGANFHEANVPIPH